jgi:hypothetical protein
MLYQGSKHDFQMMKAEFPPETPWFEAFCLWLDSGFQGVDSLYKTKELKITFRRRRTKKGEPNDLTAEQLTHNQSVSKERIVVEHALGGMKRFRMVYHRNRMKQHQIIAEIVGVTAGLWNWHLQQKSNSFIRKA